MKEFKSFMDFRYNLHLIPETVAFDVLLKINDLVMSGGNLEDEYVARKLQFASEFINKEAR